MINDNISKNVIYRFDNEYSFLSNMYPYFFNFEYKGIIFKSVENAYQSFKTKNINDKKYISTLPPKKSKKYARSLSLRKDWDEVKNKIMFKLLREKFKHKELKDMLLSTGNKLIIEGNWWNDNYWGASIIRRKRGKEYNEEELFLDFNEALFLCSPLSCKNILGKMLMIIREEAKILKK